MKIEEESRKLEVRYDDEHRSCIRMTSKREG